MRLLVTVEDAVVVTTITLQHLIALALEEAAEALEAFVVVVAEGLARLVLPQLTAEVVNIPVLLVTDLVRDILAEVQATDTAVAHLDMLELAVMD
jgi:hypothetical protein